MIETEDAFREELASIRGYLAAAQEVLREDYMPDLTVLTPRVAMLCSDLRLADKKVQAAILPEFSILLKELDACEAALHAWKKAKNVTG